NTMAELRGWTRFVGLQVPYSLTRRDIERELAPAAKSLGLGITPWGPLDGGVLTGKYSREDLADNAPADPTKPAANRSNMVKAGLTERKLAIADKVKEVAGRIGKSPSQVALRWVMQRPGVTSTILGARTADQLKDNLGALDVELDASTMGELDEASKIELGFPSDFLNGPNVTQFMAAGIQVEGERGL
ncbi:MAG: aldo/keto reductase, partial [Planctomycetes bacterium]|nr:aldo/keto reductase [Planctomycetota bacterium]